MQTNLVFLMVLSDEDRRRLSKSQYSRIIGTHLWMGLFCVNEVPENNEIRKIKYENI